MERAFIPVKSFMQEALALAEEAAHAGEVPVGAVIVRDGIIIGRGRNRREKLKQVVGHAEMEAIAQACRTLGTWRLAGCHIYVTLEPCPMCTGAVLNARIGGIIYGSDDERAGCCGSALDITALEVYAKPMIYRGFMEEACRELLQKFFSNKR